MSKERAYHRTRFTSGDSYFVKTSFKKLILLVLVSMAYQGIWAQGQDASIQVLSHATKDKIMLRWAADRPLAWKKGNESGYIVERYTVSRNGAAVIPVESTTLTSTPLVPRPLVEWETLATSDDNAAVIAQALYGDDFDVDTMGSVDNIFAVNKELEQRFTFALIAAEQNYEAAKLAGWAFEDNTAKPGEKYLYKIKVNLLENTSYPIKEGSIYASLDFYEALPIPLGFVSIFADGNALLNWNFNLLQKTYSSYILEKSTDGKTFQKVNGQPIFNAQDSKDGEQVSLFYSDSIPNNKTFYYRVKGMTPFGEVGPPSQVESGMGLASLDYTPHILRKTITDGDNVEVEWEFPEEGNTEINGFQLRRANRPEGPYKTVKENIAPLARKTRYTGLGRINYFTVVAMGKNGTEKPSFPTIVQPLDSLPPNPPKELSGQIDTTGVVRLSWKKGEELDLAGYRIFRSNNPAAEFSQITLSVVKANEYLDTVPMANLNKKVYYKLIAEDQRYNTSDFSEPLVLEKPDLIPPSPPVIKNYEASEKGTVVNWVNSSSDDVIAHVLYRKNLAFEEEGWEQLVRIEIEDPTTYVDTDVSPGRPYAYTLVALDATGLESKPTAQIVVNTPKRLYAELVSKFNGVVDRETRRIRLSWKTDEENVSEFLLYRAEEGTSLALYKTIAGDKRSFVDTDLVVSTKYRYALQLVKKDGTQSQFKEIKLTY